MPLLPRHRPYRSWGARIREYTLDGMPFIVMENEILRLGFLAGKGADLVEWLVKPLDLDLAWIAPGGIVNPAAASLSPDPVAAFMDAYPGGWQTVFPHGSIPASVHGAPYGLHGEAALLPWDALVIEDAPAAVEVAFRVRLTRMPFLIERRVRLAAGEPAFLVTETVVNESAQSFEVNWGQHITFGPPFLEPGCRILAPDGLLMQQHPVAPGDDRRAAFAGPLPWPLAPAAPGDRPRDAAAPSVAGPRGPFDPVTAPRQEQPAPGAPAASSPGGDPSGLVDLSLTPAVGDPGEMLYLSGFGPDAWIAVDNPRIGITARIDWTGDPYPCCWVWQEFGATSGWPWHGRAYVLGLEPFAGPPPNAGLGPVPGHEPLAFAPGEQKTIQFLARASSSAASEAPPVATGE